MGYHLHHIRITVSVSRHNSEQDQADDALAADLVTRVRQIVADPKYADIEPTMDVSY